MKTLSQPRAGLKAVLVALLGVALQGAGFALTVTNNKDNAPSTPLIAGSLRWAIAGTPANGLVDFSTTLKGKTILLKAGQLVVDKALNIRGLGCSSLTVSGNNVSRVFFVSGTGNSPGLASVIISDMTITKGNAVGLDISGFGNATYGGGIHNVGTLQLLRTCITGNTAALGSGGGIYNRGTLSAVTECTVSYNTAGQNGGGIFDEQDMTITRCAIYNNIAGGDGGGIQEAGTANLINTTVACNRAGGAGGGINDPGGATLKMYNVTIAGNTAAVGGGLANVPFFGASWELRNTIVSGNSAPDSPDVSNGFGSQISRGFNLIRNTSGAAAGSFLPSDQLGVDPKLGPLQNNGGPTLTMALLPGSPAIDKGSNSNLLAGMTTDQRNMARIVNGGISVTVDVGAYEYATARALKFEAINDLTPCLSSTDSRTVANARSAIRSIQCSLSSRLWVNDTKLTCSGELVFEYEEDAAYAIQKILKYSPDVACVKAATNAVQDLMQADEQIARAAIAEAIACNGNASYITKANSELVTAQASISKQDYKGAIEHYEHAWEYGQKACNRCRNDDDCRRDREDTDREDRDRWGDDDRCGGDHDDEHDD